MASWRAEMLLQLAAWAVILHVGSCFTHFSANVNDAKVGLLLIRACHRAFFSTIRPFGPMAVLFAPQSDDSLWAKND